jgi:uncharacterized protein (DUF427 family)
MGLAWQQGPLATRSVGRFLTEQPLPPRPLFAEPLRRRMKVRFADRWVADSEDVILLHEPGRYPVAYFPLGRGPGGPAPRPRRHTVAHRQSCRARGQPRRVATHVAAGSWRAMDGFYEEDERIVGHAADAYHCVDIRSTSRHLVVRDGEQVIADTQHPLALYESGFAPRWYVPREDIDEASLKLVDIQNFCPYKGICSYYDIGSHKRAAWSYVNAWRVVVRVTNLVSFEPDKIDVYLDGKQRQLEPGQTVIPRGVDRGLDTDEVLAKALTGNTQ